jgi:hypothetical protein
MPDHQLLDVCRVEIAASSTTGLGCPSEITVEKIAAISWAQVGPVIGRTEAGTLWQA